VFETPVLPPKRLVVLIKVISGIMTESQIRANEGKKHRYLKAGVEMSDQHILGLSLDGLLLTVFIFLLIFLFLQLVCFSHEKKTWLLIGFT
jgi:hypothetical protein